MCGNDPFVVGLVSCLKTPGPHPRPQPNVGAQLNPSLGQLELVKTVAKQGLPRQNGWPTLRRNKEYVGLLKSNDPVGFNNVDVLAWGSNGHIVAYYIYWQYLAMIISSFFIEWRWSNRSWAVIMFVQLKELCFFALLKIFNCSLDYNSFLIIFLFFWWELLSWDIMITFDLLYMSLLIIIRSIEIISILIPLHILILWL